jgi:hypothetical protein
MNFVPCTRLLFSRNKFFDKSAIVLQKDMALLFLLWFCRWFSYWLWCAIHTNSRITSIDCGCISTRFIAFIRSHVKYLYIIDNGIIIANKTPEMEIRLYAFDSN